jgi:hypothetical protein
MLICPDDQIEEFVLASPLKWTIRGESQFSGLYTLQQIQRLVNGENRGRAGWLLQQFLKINGCSDPALDDDDVVLIWDADTIPLRKLTFVDQTTGKIEYYTNSEFHIPYFVTIKTILGLEKRIEPSFVAQCFPMRVAWVREMTAAIEVRGDTYIETVLRSLPGIDPSEFSEYETMGTWIENHHTDEIRFRKHNRWYRNGGLWVGKRTSGLAASIIFALLSLKYDFAAVEAWQPNVTGGPITWLRAIIYELRSPGYR